MVLKLLQQKYNQANRHFLWSDEFCKLVETYSARIHADRSNKYVHIRDIVTELKAYKAKPMKQVILTTHGVGLDSDQSTESDNCPPTKRAKVEPVSMKEEFADIKQEYSGNNNVSDASLSLPSLLRFSSSSCKFVPLSAMPSSAESAAVDLTDCTLQVLGDDADSCSSFDDANSGLPVRVTASDLMPEVSGNNTELATGSVNKSSECSSDQALSCNKDVSEPVDVVKKSKEMSVKHSLKPISFRDEQQSEEAELKEPTSQTEPVAHCSKDHPEPVSNASEVNVKVASARHIRYLEMLLAVRYCYVLCVRNSSRIAALVLVGGPPQKSLKLRCFISDRDEIWQLISTKFTSIDRV